MIQEGQDFFTVSSFVDNPVGQFLQIGQVL